MTPATLEQARAAKQRVSEIFAPLAEAVGVGLTRIEDGYAVKVNLRHGPPAGSVLPEKVDDVPVRVEVVGAVRKR